MKATIRAAVILEAETEAEMEELRDAAILDDWETWSQEVLADGSRREIMCRPARPATNENLSKLTRGEDA